MCTARQYRELMAESALADVHLVAVTLSAPVHSFISVGRRARM
jgi:hypothetical protein